LLIPDSGSGWQVPEFPAGTGIPPESGIPDRFRTGTGMAHRPEIPDSGFRIRNSGFNSGYAFYFIQQ
jgi:hypothetical protein